MERAEIAEAYARLTALKSNLPEDLKVHEKYVREFHEILDLLQKTSGYDLSDFYVPAGELQPRVTSARRATIRRPGHVRYSDAKFCERSLLMMKIDGVLTFFRIQESPQKTTIGFQPPQ